MTDEIITPARQHCETKSARCGNMTGCIYGLAFVGALVYFIQHATTFWEGVLGVIKAIAWPAVLVYKALELLKM